MAARKTKAKDYGKIEKDLVALERRLQAELTEKLSNVQNTSLDDPTELLDRAAEGEIDFMSAVSAEAGSLAIEEVQLAIEKLRGGSYGTCEACRGVIHKRRLKARPFAVLCIHCKERQERAGYADAPAVVSARGDTGLTVSLTDEDSQKAESRPDDVFRDVEDMEISGLY